MRTRIVSRLLVVLLVASAPVVRGQRPQIEDPDLLQNLPDHGPLDRILAAVVRDESIDYALVAARYRLELLGYLVKMSRIDTAHLGRKERLAYYINLYNAAMILEVIEHRREDAQWGPDKDEFAVFKKTSIWIGRREMSLNDLEHKVIRPQFKDPRVHAALVCAARSCPPLLPRAYSGDDIDQVLDENMKRFVLDHTRNLIDDAKKELRLSKIFEWYADDFGGREKLAEYVGRIAGKDYRGYTVSFVEYSWELNDVER